MSSASSNTSCPFCLLAPESIVRENKFPLVIRDAYPVSPDHALIIPKRHVTSYFDATEDEKATLWAMVDVAKELIETEFKPAGYNIGINDRAATGQSVGSKTLSAATDRTIYRPRETLFNEAKPSPTPSRDLLRREKEASGNAPFYAIAGG